MFAKTLCDILRVLRGPFVCWLGCWQVFGFGFGCLFFFFLAGPPVQSILNKNIKLDLVFTQIEYP